MTKKKTHIRMPVYFKEFQCIGSSCDDNCCIGWDVEIDKKTYHKYQMVKDVALSKLFRDSIYENPNSYDRNVDFAIVELEKNNRCPFLNEKQLCMIQAKLGHAYLSNVCSAYPRYANEVNGVTEYSVNVSCPEAARLVLTRQEGLAFIIEQQNTSPNTIINIALNTTEHNGNSMLNDFEGLRNFTISLLQNRNYPLWERIFMLGHFYNALQKSTQGREGFPVQTLMDSFSERIEMDGWWAEITSNDANPALQLRFMKEVTDKLNTLTEIDSQKYVRFTEELSEGLGISGKSDQDTEVKKYKRAYEQFYKPFMQSHEYLIENYLVNYVFGGLFPASESTKPFEAYRMLAIRYALIKFYLIGISAHRRGLTEDCCVQFIQAFSKAIEHHHTYLEGIATYMNRKKYDDMPAIEFLLKN